LIRASRGHKVRCGIWVTPLGVDCDRFIVKRRDPLQLRILQNLCDILEDDPGDSLGWTRWSDRVFYMADEGIEKSLNDLWGKNFPSVVHRFVSLMSLARHSHY
jgi:hypothetical protein